MGNIVSIFNDVLGPIMTGPSSSHTAACARIGLMTRYLYGREIYNAEIIFDEKGSYPSTYIGQGSNYGFTGGLLGYPPESPKLKDSVKIAKDLGRKIIFKSDDLGGIHPNLAKINILGKDGSLEMSVMTCSTGGGMFEINKLDGFPVLIRGEKRKIFILCKCGDIESKVIEKLSDTCYSTITTKDHIFFDITPDEDFNEESMCMYAQNPDVVFYRVAERILPVELKADLKPVFINASEALRFNFVRKLKLWELAVKYETSIGKISSKGVFKKAENVLDAMKGSMEISKAISNPYGFLKPTANTMANNLEVKNLVDVGILNKVVVRSTATMENNCAHGIIVAAPTAGSCGVVPASIITVAEGMGFNDKKTIEALLSAGIVGAFIGNQATFGAETAGCQAENGSASAMAAAGVAYLLGGTVEECFKAASLALQNLLGLICDPIAGLTEIPCINRNAVSATNAIISANMVIAGYDPIIPLDETIFAMMKTGKQMPSELRCTCKGGLCITKTGKTIAAEMNRK